ncbi:MAG: M48 family metallopeptidase [Negativicutes bacterium]|nr:M48 family metallopeptidase [Negativicutes bacterium]
MMFRRAAKLLFGIIVLYSIYSVPLAEAALIGTKEEISIGRSVAQELEKKYGLVEDQALQDRVARIGASIAAVADRKDLPYSFRVLNAKEVNALAIPGGFIYIFKGLVDYMPSDDELAGVISHEIGHIVKRHSVKQMEKSLAVSLLFGAVFGDRGVLLQNLAYNAIMAGYSRSDEREADQLGFYQSLRAGYNPYSMLLTLKKLDDLDQKGSYGIFSSHPEPEARANLVREYIRKANVRPQVTVTGTKAEIADGDWKLPAFTVKDDTYKPEYRAYFAAGALHRLSRLADFQPDRLIVFEEEGKATLYYDDIKIMTLHQADAAAAGMSLADLAEQYIRKIREWSEAKRDKSNAAPGQATAAQAD